VGRDASSRAAPAWSCTYASSGPRGSRELFGEDSGGRERTSRSLGYPSHNFLFSLFSSSYGYGGVYKRFSLQPTVTSGNVEAVSSPKQLETLFKRHGGLCYWCRQPMILIKGNIPHVPDPPNRATIDHLDDRFSPQRGKMIRNAPQTLRHVAACRKCNMERGKRSEQSQPREVLVARSKQHKSVWNP
jgi:hypothetical protein